MIHCVREPLCEPNNLLCHFFFSRPGCAGSRRFALYLDLFCSRSCLRRTGVAAKRIVKSTLCVKSTLHTTRLHAHITSYLFRTTVEKSHLDYNLLLSSLEKSKWVGLGSPLAICSMYGDLICSVHTVNKLHFLRHKIVIEDHMVDWHSCQKYYPLEIKILLLSILLLWYWFLPISIVPCQADRLREKQVSPPFKCQDT